jgi:hypothetical protein
MPEMYSTLLVLENHSVNCSESASEFIEPPTNAS